MRVVISFFLISIVVLSGKAQNQEDALRFSMLNTVGTARYAGAGGAFGAMGADITVMAMNPAGLARLRSSIFSFSPELSTSSTSTNFRSNQTLDGNSALNFSNLGIVGTSKAGKDSPYLWKTVQYGLAYNKTALFNNNYTVSGVSDTSLSYQFAGMAGVAGQNGIAPSDLYSYDSYQAGLAYDAYLIDPADYSGTFYTSQMRGGGYSFTNQTKEKGSIGEWDLSLAANYNDKLYLGGTVGFTRLNYQRTREHTEHTSDSAVALSYFNYTEYLQTTGRGVNLKLGMIVLPIKQLRIGLAYHTKTSYYYMQDQWHNDMYTNFHDTASHSSQSNYGNYLYTLKTPSRVIASVSGVILKKVILSAEAEMVNYSTSRLKQHHLESYHYSFGTENNNIKTMFSSAMNIRSGVEVRVTKPLIVRAGFGIYGSPYKTGVVQTNSKMLQFSGGAGYHMQKFYIDVAYMLSQYKQDYYMYDPVLVEDTPVTIKKGSIIVTTGFKF